MVPEESGLPHVPGRPRQRPVLSLGARPKTASHFGREFWRARGSAGACLSLPRLASEHPWAGPAGQVVPGSRGIGNVGSNIFMHLELPDTCVGKPLARRDSRQCPARRSVSLALPTHRDRRGSCVAVRLSRALHP
jgi:hypothetical protein